MVNGGVRALCAALVACAISLGCDVVLGIEEARVDPSIAAGTGGDGSGGTGTGGTGTGGTGAGGGAGGSSGVGGGTGTGGSGGAGGADAPQKPLCEEYCEEITNNCPDDSTKQYADLGQCLATCALFEPGQDGDRNVNTVHCRLTRARSAQSEPSLECPRAGPSPGMNGCGTTCDAYCALMMGACNEQTTQGTEGYFFESHADCMSACQQVPDTQPYVFNQNPGLITGNHLGCRLYHVVVATEGDFEHCDHAIGGSLCVP